MAAGAEIIWVLEQDRTLRPGTAKRCVDVMETLGSDLGWCVGDSQTMPEPGTFDDSPFSDGRGFDIIVDRATMEVVFVSNHGTPSGNENLTGAQILEAVQAAVAE